MKTEESPHYDAYTLVDKFVRQLLFHGMLADRVIVLGYKTVCSNHKVLPDT